MTTFERVPVSRAFEGLGEAFYSRISLRPLEEARLVHLNTSLGSDLNLGWLESEPESLVRLFNGECPLGGATPLSSLYAGHQFGVWVSQLGDGRAALLAQIEDAQGNLWEIQSKGGGPTPYSRHADGRAVLRSSIREYLVSEAMHGLGIATTRSLGLLDSSTPVHRESVERGAILIRVAPTHLRFGHFEVFASRNQLVEVRQLADYLIKYHFSHLADRDNPYLELYQEVIRRTASTIAGWQAVGFCHGVMNTDNMSMLGLTLDYGPFGFMEQFDPGHICNHSDQNGRYAYANQPGVAHWNLACLGNAMLSLIPLESAQAALESYPEHYERAWKKLMSAKMGLDLDTPEHLQLAQQWLLLLQVEKADYTQSFRLLADYVAGENGASDRLDQRFGSNAEWHAWRRHYDQALSNQKSLSSDLAGRMQRANPVYVLRNSLAQKAIEKAEAGSYDEVDRLFQLLQNPFRRQAGAEEYENPPSTEPIVLSCSS